MREFSERLDDWAESPPLSVALADVDGFMAVNQDYGHDVGDEVLAFVERTLAASLPKGTKLARIGGDEFACALPRTSPEEALILLEEVRKHVAAKRQTFGDHHIPVRLSIGIASFPQHTEDPGRLLRAAHDALHRAKQEGRNRVAIYVEDKMVLKSSYYPRAQLARLSVLSDRLGRTEASLLREALDAVLERYRAEL